MGGRAVTAADIRGRVSRAIQPRAGADIAWMRDGACVNSGDPEAWFPNTDVDNYAEYAYAKRMCRTCPVATECLAWALAVPELNGCWGGTTPRDRESLRRKAREGAA